MKRLSSRFYLTFGLCSLFFSVYMLAVLIGLVPDREQALRASRAAMAETIAVSASILLSREDRAALGDFLQFTLQRNRDIESIGVRDAKGELVGSVGAHAQRWRTSTASDDQLEVPIFEGRQRWGTAELKFVPVGPPGWRGLVFDPRVALGAFLTIASFFVFYWYLRRMLRHLDPSRAIPTRVRAALDTLAEGLLVIDPQGVVVLSNSAFAEAAGVAADELIGKPAAKLGWCERDGAPLDAAGTLPWQATLEEGETRRNQTLYFNAPNGGRRTLSVNCTAILGVGVKNTPVLVSLDDVTELEEKEIQLRAAKDEADEANRAKSAFLANMSHEIRTPMNAILGFTELLRRGSRRSETDVRRHLDTIHSSGSHLLELINDILDLSKVEAGRMEIERIACSPADVLREIVKVLGVRAAEKSIELVLEFDAPLPERIETDPARLRQIVTNLVGNAIKFTSKGAVRVTPRLRGEGAETKLAISVTDSGIGIAPDKLGSIFESFSQADTSINRRFGGTGLGLSISRQLASLLGGHIEVESTQGVGSTFSVVIDPGPLQGVRRLSVEELRAGAETSTAQTAQRWIFPRGTRVLVVDDGRENRELVRLVLEEVGIEVAEAENGQVALDALARETYGCVLMDVQMPVMDGMTATRLLRERGNTVPVIAMTANVMKGFDGEIEQAGYSGYVAKPIDIDLLLAELAGRLGGAPAGVAEVAEKTLVAPADAGERIVSRLADHPRLSKVVARFVAELPAKLDAMQAVAQRGEFAELAALAHWLKGSGGTVGFDVFFEPSVALEERAKAADAVGVAAALEEIQSLGARVTGMPRTAGAPLVAPEPAPATRPAPSHALEAASRAVPIVSRLASHPRLRKVVSRFVAELPGRLEAMHAASESRDLEQLASLAHWLKGAGGTVGFDELFEPARRLEEVANAADQAGIRASLAELRAIAARIIAPSDEPSTQA